MSKAFKSAFYEDYKDHYDSSIDLANIDLGIQLGTCYDCTFVIFENFKTSLQKSKWSWFQEPLIFFSQDKIIKR